MLKRCQSIVEYTFLLGLVSIALLAMNTYARRGVQAIIKTQADKISPQENYTVVDDPDWFQVWSPKEPLSKQTRRAENLLEQKVDASTKTVHTKVGSFQDTGQYQSFSVNDVVKDIEIP